ncbi:CDP-glycerol glycerophosphotransferase family protein [Ureibacillus sinduriensis]|uniref:CDP-glycerol:glycerophosphate glycerophosphotransferase n=1 Tax=Ureibacillus sinduriensis BLB-1 = JCM 15800 TaxID=1384057 RepID=A0A0A3HV54_9BACL|nr:CDP-glycerol glycerophosphotransferase family protein [Ureibacillus sinduriensis]KGR76481.1 hypothetical protein CD33_06320 [Ureibacillus sinduriensis BLB-1 = JCM 15800]
MKKRIGLTCTTVFHYVHFSGIAKELEKMGYQVEYIIYTPYHINERVERLIEVFEQNNITYCGFEQLFDKTVEFDALLAPYYMPGFQLLDKDLIKIRGLYGYAKDSWNYAEWNKGFDLVLSYGPYATKRLTAFAEVADIGHPRLTGNYLKTVIDINGNELSIEKLTDRKTLVYCPTWADLSSLDIFVENVVSLTKEFNVIVKLHHGNVLSGNNEKWEALKNIDTLYLYDEFTNLFDLLQFADIILSDYSGAIFDAMLFKKPIVLLDIIDENILDTGSVNLDKMANISLYNNVDVTNISLDIQIRDILPHVKDPSELLPTLITALDMDIPYLELLNELYTYQDSLANERAAKAIHLAMSQEKKHWDNDESFHIIDEEAIKNFLNHNKNDLSVWGAGLSGQIIVSWLKGNNIAINRLMDADTFKQGKEFLNYKIEKPIVEKGIIITVTGKGLKAIRELCSKSGLQEGKDFISIFK